MTALTATDVHSTIQKMNKDFSVNDNAIPIEALAKDLHVQEVDLLIHLDTLASLRYLRFTDGRKNIRLTFNGANTLVPS